MKKLVNMVIFGDSMSTMTHGDCGYEKALGLALPNIKLCNHSVGGSGISSYTPHSLINRLKQSVELCKSADIIFVWMGTNDWYWGSPLMKSIDSFQVNLKIVIKKLKQSSPNATVLLGTPIFRYENPFGVQEKGSAYSHENVRGHTLFDYYSCIVAIAKEFNVRLIDFYRNTPFSIESMNLYYEDGVHLNSLGYRYISNLLIKELKKIRSY